MSPAKPLYRPSQASSGQRLAPSRASVQTTSSSLRYPTMEPIKPRSRSHSRSGRERLHSNSSSTMTKSGIRPASAQPSQRSHQTSITVIEPKREDYSIEKPQKKEQSPVRKAVKGAGNAVGFCLYILSFCCVLSGEKRPEPVKKRGAYYYNYDEELEGARVSKVDSNGSGSKASSEKIERV